MNRKGMEEQGEKCKTGGMRDGERGRGREYVRKVRKSRNFNSIQYVSFRCIELNATRIA